MWDVGHRDLRLPRILGHEIVGITHKTGERVVIWPGQVCGFCEFCRSHRENICPQMQILGFSQDGGLAQQVVVPESNLIPIPAGLSIEVAALAEPLACGLNALTKTSVGSGDTVLIFGAGPVGLLMALGVQERDAQPFLLEKDVDKLTLSKEFRTVTGILAAATTDQSHWDVCINAAPSVTTFSEGVGLLKAGGRFCIFSGFPGTASVSEQILNHVHYRELSVNGAYGCTRSHMQNALEILLKHQQAVELLIESIIPLSEVEQGFERILAGKTMKILVDPLM